MTELLSFWADARAEMNRHGLHDWKLVYSATRGQALGTTTHGTRTIKLSAPHIEDGTREQGWDTVLHEIAHALCDPKAGHGPTWRRTARRLGANPSTTAHGSPSDADSYSVVGTCPSGLHTYGRSRMPSKGRYYLCTKCRGPEAARRITWSRNSTSVSVTVKAAVASFGEVKEYAWLDVGRTVEIDTPSLAKWHGKTGTIVKTGRTKYVVEIAGYNRLIALPANCVKLVL